MLRIEDDGIGGVAREGNGLAGDGRSGADIAHQLQLSEGTVRNYLSEAISQVGGTNRVDAARIARTKGWL